MSASREGVRVEKERVERVRGVREEKGVRVDKERVEKK